MLGDWGEEQYTVSNLGFLCKLAVREGEDLALAKVIHEEYCSLYSPPSTYNTNFRSMLLAHSETYWKTLRHHVGSRRLKVLASQNVSEQSFESCLR